MEIVILLSNCLNSNPNLIRTRLPFGDSLIQSADRMASQDKYDRQLRLWGSHGQRCLAGAHILLVQVSILSFLSSCLKLIPITMRMHATLQANGAGCETMKNLVLPGIGRFTVADDSIVSEADLDCNFFIRSTDLGRNRAEV